MHAYSLIHLNGPEVLRSAAAYNRHERTNAAMLIAHIAEIDARELYLPAGFPSTYEYCRQELRLTEQSALKRIRAGRVAREFPAIFDAIAEGRVHLTGVIQLKPHLTPRNADELLAAATHKTQGEIEKLLAERFPSADMPARIEAIPSEPAPEAELLTFESTGPVGQLSAQTVAEQVSARTPATQHARVKPLSPQRYGLQFTIDQETHDDLRQVQALLGHRVRSGDLADVFGRALKSLRKELEKRKYAATDRPRTGSRGTPTAKRTIPAHVRRAVRKRDQDQCAFVGENGHRCTERKELAFDHIEPVARGGEATVDNVRLLCHAHNQYEAKRVFGDGFMHQKREEARIAREERQAKKMHEAKKAQEAQAKTATEEVIPWLQALGVRTDQARRAAEHSASLADAPLEQRVRLALSCLRPRAYSITPAPASVGSAP